MSRGSCWDLSNLDALLSLVLWERGTKPCCIFMPPDPETNLTWPWRAIPRFEIQRRGFLFHGHRSLIRLFQGRDGFRRAFRNGVSTFLDVSSREACEFEVSSSRRLIGWKSCQAVGNS